MGKRKRWEPPRLYKRDLTKATRWTLLLFYRGTFSPGPTQYVTRAEAEDALLRWDRVRGPDNEPVYAIGVMRHYWNPKHRLERRFAIRCMNEVLAGLQADRLQLVEALERAKKAADG